MYNENIDLEDETESSNGFDFKSFYNNNKKLIWVLLGIIIFIIFVSMITSCGRTSNNGNTKNNEEEPTLVLNNKNEIIAIGSSKQITASVTNYPNAFIMYSSNNPNIATISSNGLVTGKGIGTTTINAVYIHSGNKVLREECLVTVTPGSNSEKVSSIDLPDGDLVMGVGKTFDLSDKLVINPYNAYVYQKHFASKDKNIVKVESNGMVKALREGTTYIDISINNTFETKIKVIVLNKNINSEIVEGPSAINIESNLIKLKVNQSKKIKYTTTPSNINANTLTWTSSNPNIVTVNNNGEIKGLSEGSSTITVTSSNGISSKTIVEVSQYGDDVLIDTISYSQSVINLTTGATFSIVPTITPTNASNKTLTFTSSNPSVVQVTSTGGISAIVTAINPGTATIIFQSSNGKQGSCIINVTGNNYNNSSYNNYNYNNGGSNNNSSYSNDNNSSSNSNTSSNNNSNSSSTNTLKYASITINPSSLSLLSSSYTTFKIKANMNGTFELSTSRSEIYFPSNQAKIINVSEGEEVSIQVRGSKKGTSSITGYIHVKFTPSDTSIKHLYKNIDVTVN